MRILYLGTLPPHPGGSAMVGAQIIRGLALQGHEVMAVAPITAAALSRGDDFALSNSLVQVRRLLVPFFDIIPGLARDDYLRAEHDQLATILPRAYDHLRPDVVLIGRESFAWHLPLIPGRASTPTALIVHGGSTAGALSESNPTAEALRKLFASVDLLIAVATHVARDLEALGLTHTKIIPNPVDIRVFCRQPQNGLLRRRLGIDDEDIVVVHASNLKPVKRPLDLIHLASTVYQPRLIYVIVGDGPLRPEMEQECRTRRIAERFRFVGWVSHERVPQFLNLADLVIMPSESEGQALVHLETQACGRLLIASDTPGAREVVRDGQTGLLFPAGSLGDLAVTTAMAASNSMLRATIGRAAEIAAREHAVDVIVSKYAATLEELARQPRLASAELSRGKECRAQHQGVRN